MIQRLSIQGLAIIDTLSIEFSPGFNVITGETGAGKSILIRALNLLMGAKASPDTVRQGSEQASILGEFVVPKNHPAVFLLGNLGIPLEEDGDGYPIIIRRQITAKNRSQSWVNDVVMTNQPLRELGTALVDVFAQHENQKLLDPASHTAYVDQFLKDRAILGRIHRAHEACFAIIQQLREKIESFHDRHKNHDYLSFRLEALLKFEPTTDDFEKVKALCESSESDVQFRDTLSLALQALNQSEGDTLANQLKEAGRILSKLSSNTAISVLKDRTLALAAEVEDLHYELEKLGASLEVDEGELEAAQKRLYDYQDLFRKHSVKTIEELVGEKERIQGEMEFLESAAGTLEGLLKDLKGKTKDLIEGAKDLTQAREKAAAQIKKKVETELHDLAMPGSRFQIEFTPVARTLPPLSFSAVKESLQTLWDESAQKLGGLCAEGNEKAQFLLATNPGEPILPLSRIASGGELSRIMLAFKKSLAADAETCVLVFDEIDTGISGRVADVVGRKMQELAHPFQVICISHLPQVAVYADTHFLVKKEGKGSRTQTAIVKLSADQSAREIARLLSGDEVSNPSLANAKNLIAKAKMRKNSLGREARLS